MDILQEMKSFQTDLYENISLYTYTLESLFYLKAGTQNKVSTLLARAGRGFFNVWRVHFALICLQKNKTQTRAQSHLQCTRTMSIIFWRRALLSNQEDSFQLFEIQQ